MKRTNASSFLLEIGTEEIPARFFSTAIESLRMLTAEAFAKHRIEHTTIKCMATPRRIAVTTEITNTVQKTAVSEVVGPPVRAAYDGSGNPTKAAEGFARSQSMDVSELTIKKTDRGDYVAAVRKIPGEKVQKVLPGIVPDIIRSIPFPKSMRWGSRSLRFARPIRWILCLLDSSVVRFELDGIRSGNATFGHRLLAPRRIMVRRPADYEKLLGKAHVIANHVQRRAAVEKEIGTLAKKAGAKVVRDEALLDHVNFLVEQPRAVLCEFDEEYLKLPPELLITVMKDHQKYFALTRKGGAMLNAFIVISNTNARCERAVREGAQKVIRARFEDAKFYFTEDIKTSLVARLELLKRITYHEKIGTLFEKVQRVRSIAGALAGQIFPEHQADIERAAELCKSDLTTGVVREFPELQGIIGQYYAGHDGLAPGIALAVREHYKPLNASDSIPSSDAARLVSLADKIDSVVAFFSSGIIPSGSEDPYALRRQAQGVVQVLAASDYPLTVNGLIAAAIKSLRRGDEDVASSVRTFFLQRIEFALLGAGHPDDVVRSIIGDALGMRLSSLQQKAGAVAAFKREPGYAAFITAIKRLKNIIPPAALDTPAADLLSTPPEQALLGASDRVAKALPSILDRDDFTGALVQAESLTPFINDFFDKVMVMDRDEQVRNARLALLKTTWQAVSRICDFSQLTER